MIHSAYNFQSIYSPLYSLTSSSSSSAARRRRVVQSNILKVYWPHLTHSYSSEKGISNLFEVLFCLRDHYTKASFPLPSNSCPLFFVMKSPLLIYGCDAISLRELMVRNYFSSTLQFPWDRPFVVAMWWHFVPQAEAGRGLLFRMSSWQPTYALLLCFIVPIIWLVVHFFCTRVVVIDVIRLSLISVAMLFIRWHRFV